MRLAWFSPWPPQRSGIAGRSAELVPALARRGYGIDVYVHEARLRVDAQSAAPVETGAVRLLGAHDFIWRHRREPYDLTVYQVGNSVLHDYIWPYLVRWPGLAVLHDARLHHARGRALLAAGRADAYRQEFAWAHPGVSPDAAELAVLGLGGTYLYGWPMTRSVLASSRLVAVHAQGAIAELAETQPAAPIEYVPLGEGRDAPWSGAERRAGREALGIPAAAIVFGVFGALTAEKRVPEIVRAFAQVRARLPNVHLLLAGTLDPNLDVLRVVRSLGVADSVQVAPALTDAGFDRTLAAVDISLNLRWPSALETSGPWLRALAAERATIVIDLPHMGHVPSLDPRSWRLHEPAGADRTDAAAVAVAIDILDEEHSLRLAMHRLATDSPLRDALGRNARAFWEAGHAVTHMVDGMDRAIHRAVTLPDPRCPLPPALVSDPFAHADAIVSAFGDPVRSTVRDLAGLVASEARDRPC